MSEFIEIKLTADGERHSEPIRFSIPLQKGAVVDATMAVLRHATAGTFPAQCRPLLHWPDGSCKWVLVDALVDLTPEMDPAFVLELGHAESATLPPFVTESRGGITEADTGACCLTLGKNNHLFSEAFFSEENEAAKWCGQLQLTCVDQSTAQTTIKRVCQEDQGPLHCSFLVSGEFTCSDRTLAEFICHLHVFRGSSRIGLDITLRNPHRAHHPNGLWDLGDSGSLLFRGFGLSLSSADTSAQRMSLSCGSQGQVFSCQKGELALYQEGCGGLQWDSPVHRNRHGHVPLQVAGYRVLQDGEALATGERALPVGWLGTGANGVGVAVRHFWQNCPQTLKLTSNAIDVELFPNQYADLHELQGGEQKTFNLLIDLHCSPESPAWFHNPICVNAPALAFKTSGAVAWMPGTAPAAADSPAIAKALNPQTLLDKRDVCGEYGWRHFGEVYADHEAVNHQGQKPFVSHYNNQYDLVFSCYRQFLASSDPRWQQLASDLARHVIDIDLYHTDEDREEYNHGLFWHTDHYLDAGTATHRSFSKLHLSQKNPLFCGGGPAAEHCYTTGLLYHYLLTGDEQARSAVISLADWCLRTIGQNLSVFASLNRARRLLIRWRSQRGSKTVFSRYPLTRGTGNGITACLDAFELTGNPEYLNNAAALIRGTVHPDDQIDDRNLLNAELGWSYTVFLVAVGKFLDKKLEIGSLDSDFSYARRALLVYADWMAENEYPYLEKPDILEYPNETWAAQDLRKAVVFYYAARFARSGDLSRFRERALYFWEAGIKELDKWETKGLTRPVALVLQNAWVASRLEDIETFPGIDAPAEEFGSSTPYLNGSNVIRRVAGDLYRALQNTSLQRELAWLRAKMR